ncbi:MAG: hypothetical protein ACRCXT_21275 [Paraclostridium sp.]
MKERIRDLYLKGYNAKEIAYKVGKSDVAIRLCIHRNFKDLTELHKEQLKIRQELIKRESKDRIKYLYLKGYNAKEIADILNLTHGYMKIKIMEDLKEYKAEHIKTRALNKEIIKSVDSMNSSYIGNSSLLNWNRQSYEYNKNGNIVFNELERGTKPIDLPKAFYVNNKETNHLRKDDKVENMASPYEN